MYEDYPPLLVAATPNDVLAVLRDQYLQQCTFDRVVERGMIDLSRDTSIADWWRATEYFYLELFANAMNKYWDMYIPRDRWKKVLKPAAVHTLGEVCDLIASEAKMHRVRSARILGRECLPAGVFLTVRSYLANAGAEVRDIAPSTCLADYTSRYSRVFLGRVTQLAPGVLPAARVRYRIFDLGCELVLFAGFLGAPIGALIGSYMTVFVSLLAIGLAYLCAWIFACWICPPSMEFPGLKTFRDLSMVIAKGHINLHPQRP